MSLKQFEKTKDATISNGSVLCFKHNDHAFSFLIYGDLRVCVRLISKLLLSP